LQTFFSASVGLAAWAALVDAVPACVVLWATTGAASSNAADKLTIDVRRMITLPNDIPMTTVVDSGASRHPPFVGWSMKRLC
jgi:hypothetical protein